MFELAIFVGRHIDVFSAPAQFLLVEIKYYCSPDRQQVAQLLELDFSLRHVVNVTQSFVSLLRVDTVRILNQILVDFSLEVFVVELI